MTKTDSRSWRSLWRLDPDVVFLNHGSFGACPAEILDLQSRFRDELENEPIVFMMRELEPLLDAARDALGDFLNTPPEALVFVTNSTAGINTILRSLDFESGEELLTTSHVYNACGNALDFVARRSRAHVVRVDIPYPLASPGEVTSRILGSVTPRTRLAVIDHVTSATGMVLPIADIVRELESRGVKTIVDGAHAPGMVELSIRDLAPSWYVGNCHKWLCAPKGAAFIYASESHRNSTRPLTISHGANSQRTDRSRWHQEFDWPGTVDFTPVLCLPRTIEYLGSLLPGGWPELRRRNRRLALDARAMLCQRLEWEAPCPEAMIGTLVALQIPTHVIPNEATAQSLHDQLFEEHGIEALFSEFPLGSGRVSVRVSAALYNELEDFEKLARAMETMLRGD